MDWLSLLLKLSHVSLAMAIVAGMLGSRLLNRRARLSGDIDVAWRLTRAAEPFDQLAERSGPLLILSGFLTAWTQGLPFAGLVTGWILLSIALLVLLLVLILTVFRPAGARVEAALRQARQEGRITPELRAAWQGGIGQRVASVYGDLAAPAIIVLMILKPF
ncbi:MAG: DUF2269 family protein [Chloroflexi bacterium]|nr:DUF2269 family protein [Chloroflexota bacterium]